MLRGTSIVATVLMVTSMMAASAAAQEKGPIRILVGVQAGATTDTIARMLAEKMRDSLGDTIIVENKPGASQRIAMAELRKAPPDGRTMFLGSSAVYSILPHVYGDQTGYDPFKDAIPLTRVVAFQVGIGAGLHINASNIAEFVAWAKANPSKVSFASPGAGTSSHFTGLMLSKALGIPMTHVPYRGTAPALTDIYGGHVPVVFTAYSDLPEPAAAGKLKILATAGPKRSPATPNTPTLKEQGIDIAFDVAFDMHTNAGVPADAVKRLNAALVKAIKDPDVQARLEKLGVQPVGSTPEALAAMQAEEYKLWAAPVKDSGYKGD